MLNCLIIHKLIFYIFSYYYCNFFTDIIIPKFFLSLIFFLHKILFSYILGHIQYDTYNSILYVINYLWPEETHFLCFILEAKNCNLIITKEDFIIKGSSLKLKRTTGLSGGFLSTIKNL